MPSKNSTGASAGSEPSGRAKGGDLLTRTLSALVLGPAVLASVALGGWVFNLVICIFAALTAVEWVRLVEPERSGKHVLPVLAATIAALGLAIVLGAALGLGVAAALTILLFAVVRFGQAGHARLLAFTVPYVALGSYAMVWLREQPGVGLFLLLYLLLVVWATDIGAYAAGRTIGGPKLAPGISPKKTWAGLGGGMAAAAALGAAVAAWSGFFSPWPAALLAALLAVVAQAGDLFESAIKRRFNVKDSGRIIPGHGGLLDRVDGLLAGAPFFALFHAIWGMN